MTLVTLTAPCRVLAADQGDDAARERTVGGPILEYGVRSTPGGPFGAVTFAPGSLEVEGELSRVKLLRDHDTAQPLGVLAALDDADDAADAVFRMGRHAAADEALTLAADRVLDGFSVGVEPIEWDDDGDDGVTITRARLREVSLVALPAYTNARATRVTAERTPPVNDTITKPAPETPPTAPAPAVDLTATIRDTLRDALAERAPEQAAPLTAPSVTAATGTLLRASDRPPSKYPGVFGRDGRFVTAGDFFATFATGINSGDWDAHNSIKAALADELSSDVPGNLPQQIVGEILGRANGRRTVWDSFSSRDMPMIGEKFSRPRITQHVKVDEQTAQKTEVVSQKYTTALEDVAKKTLAGALDISQQAIDWTSPALLNELISDFTAIYLARTDHYAASALLAAAKGTAVAWDGEAATLNGVLAQAAANVYGSVDEFTDVFPNVVWLSVDMWVKLAALTDADGRPLLPQLGPTNANGQVDLSNPESGSVIPGFRWVVSKRLPAGTMIMGDRSFCESYENGRRFLQAIRPEVLGLDLAYMGYTATYFPYPKSLVPITVTAPTETAKAGK